MIQGDISKCFDSVDQKRLINILKKVFHDQHLLDVIIKIFSSPIKGIEKGGQDISKGRGLPQGNPMSPILMNVYLNEFDNFINDLMEEHNKGKPVSTTTKE